MTQVRGSGETEDPGDAGWWQRGAGGPRVSKWRVITENNVKITINSRNMSLSTMRVCDTSGCVSTGGQCFSPGAGFLSPLQVCAESHAQKTHRNSQNVTNETQHPHPLGSQATYYPQLGCRGSCCGVCLTVTDVVRSS